VQKDDIKNGGFGVIVSGRSKGCGSSRETAPYSELESGVSLVVARSIEKIYGQNSQNIGADVADVVRRLKNEAGPDLLTQGSSQLLHTLFKHDLVDEIHLSIFPVVLGAGKRLFVDGISPGSLKLVSSRVSGSGVTVNKYVRDGQIRTGNFQMEPPTEAELRRRKNLT